MNVTVQLVTTPPSKTICNGGVSSKQRSKSFAEPAPDQIYENGNDSGVEFSGDSSSNDSFKRSASFSARSPHRTKDGDEVLSRMLGESCDNIQARRDTDSKKPVLAKSKRGSFWNLFKLPLQRSSNSTWSLATRSPTPSKRILEKSETFDESNLSRSQEFGFLSNKNNDKTSDVGDSIPSTPVSTISSYSGDVPGITGMHNLGNTCYLNAIIQCLAHIDLVSEYFALGSYKQDLLGQESTSTIRRKYKSAKTRDLDEFRLTLTLAELIKSLWQSKLYDLDLCHDFHKVVASQNEQFAGVHQHDAQEFFMWLIDKVHEDCTKSPKKKYKNMKQKKRSFTEDEQAVMALASYTQYNNSYIQGLFLSQYRSSIQCSNCHRQSSTFDPFTLISLPIPQPEKRPVYVTIVYALPTMSPIKYAFAMRKVDTVFDLKTNVFEETRIPKKSLLLFEIASDGRQTRCKPDSPVGLLTSREDILHGFEIPEQCHLDSSMATVDMDEEIMANSVVMIVTNVEVNGQQHKRFGPPMILLVSKDLTFKQIQLLIRRNMKQEFRVKLSGVIKTSQMRLGMKVVSSANPKCYLSNTVAHPLKEPDVSRAALRHPYSDIKYLNIIAEWEPTPAGWYLMDITSKFVLENASCQDLRDSYSKRIAVDLHDCLNLHTQEEKLQHEDAWTCPSCRTEQRGITKKLSLWSIPDILVLHLKRFDQIHQYNSKISTLVEFPLHELNMSQHVHTNSINNNASPRSITKNLKKASIRLAYQPPPQAEEDCIYDLQAVCNHVGGDLHSGHYVASCWNSADGHWYCFNDRKVRMMAEDEVVTPGAYLLFYVRRKFSSRVPKERCESVSKARTSPINHWSYQMPKQHPAIPKKYGSVSRNHLTVPSHQQNGFALHRTKSAPLRPIHREDDEVY